jgi:hypothetical protein
MGQETRETISLGTEELSLGVERDLVEIYSDFIVEDFSLRKEVTFQNSKNLPIHGWFHYTQ